MAGNRLKRSSNKVVIAGEPLVEEMTAETIANIYAGRLVEKGTNENDCVLNGTTAATLAGTQNPIGWVGYEQASVEYKPATKATIYKVGDFVPILKGGGFIIDALAVDNSANTIVKGDLLKAATTYGGVLKAAYTDPSVNGARIIAIAEENVTPQTTGTAILVRSLI